MDAIQALGQLPLDVQATPVDVLSCGGQKWLLSPWGSGFLYVRRPLIPQLEPELTGWMAFEGTDDFTRLTDYNDRLRLDARRFELITIPFQDILGMNQSLKLLRELGIGMVRDHLAGIQRPLIEWAERRGVAITSPRGPRGSGIICVAPPRLEECYRALRRDRIYVSQREGALRISPHCYNTIEEMERVAAVLDALL